VVKSATGYGATSVQQEQLYAKIPMLNHCACYLYTVASTMDDMDPISVILAALAPSAAAGASRVAKDIVPDAYKCLKQLILKKTINIQGSGNLLANHDSDPQAYEASLIQLLTKAGVDKDVEILNLANNINKELINKRSTVQNTICIHGGEMRGAIQNNAGIVTQIFN